jgi:hypothetical protein
MVQQLWVLGREKQTRAAVLLCLPCTPRALRTLAGRLRCVRNAGAPGGPGAPTSLPLHVAAVTAKLGHSHTDGVAEQERGAQRAPPRSTLAPVI